MLSAAEKTRYSRHILLPEVGLEGQQKLRRAHVFVIGAGGLGSPVLLYLAAAGVGTITLVDDDLVDLTNLQRQVLFTGDDLGSPKAYSAAARLRALNDNVQVLAHQDRISAANIAAYGADADLWIETSDNFPTKFLVNDAAYFQNKPLVAGGILRFEGQVLAVQPGQSACYRCLFQSPPPPEHTPSCSEAGVVGAIAGVIGALQAAEALKILTGSGTPLFGRMIIGDLLGSAFRTINLPRNPECILCSPRARIKTLRDVDAAGYCLAG